MLKGLQNTERTSGFSLISKYKYLTCEYRYKLTNIATLQYLLSLLELHHALAMN